jgi:hypothetical protein
MYQRKLTCQTAVLSILIVLMVVAMAAPAAFSHAQGGSQAGAEAQVVPGAKEPAVATGKDQIYKESLRALTMLFVRAAERGRPI